MIRFVERPTRLRRDVPSGIDSPPQTYNVSDTHDIFGGVHVRLKEGCVVRIPAASSSRTVLAADIGVAVETLVTWETGRATPHADSLAALSAALGCSIDALFSELTENDPATGEPRGHSTTASCETHDTA
jgi:DNA-binding XRE family transcriptional regulator